MPGVELDNAQKVLAACGWDVKKAVGELRKWFWVEDDAGAAKKAVQESFTSPKELPEGKQISNSQEVYAQDEDRLSDEQIAKVTLKWLHFILTIGFKMPSLRFDHFLSLGCRVFRSNAWS